MCLGMRYAMVQMKMFLYHLLKKYEISLPEGYQMKPILLPIPRPRDGLPLIIKKAPKNPGKPLKAI